jgi:hypothetical protein
LGGTPRDGAIDWDYPDSGLVEECIDCRVCPLVQRADEGLCVDGRANEQLVSSHKPGAELRNGTSVLVVPRIKERDHNVRVQRYSRHSSRN